MRTVLFVEEMSPPLAERGLSQYNEGVNRHCPSGGRLLANAGVLRGAGCGQVSVRRWFTRAREAARLRRIGVPVHL